MGTGSNIFYSIGNHGNFNRIGLYDFMTQRRKIMTQDILYPEEVRSACIDRMCEKDCQCVYGLGIPGRGHDAQLVYTKVFVGIAFKFCPMCGKKLEGGA